MAKRFKNIFIGFIGILSMMLAGVFFVGCGINYNKIQLVSDKAEVFLDVGQEEEIVFRIKGYQSGFSSRVSVDGRFNGQSAVFTTSDPEYVGKDEIHIKVKAVAGGQGQLFVKTLDGGKECSVTVSVEQYSSTMTIGEGLMYVSGKTPFIPSQDMFSFAPNTTNKELSFYYLFPGESKENLNNFTFAGIEYDNERQQTIATFTSGELSVKRRVERIDQMRYDESQNKLIGSFQGVDISADFVLDETFSLLSVYDRSVVDPSYSSAVFNVSDVYILRDLNVSFSGGYLRNGKIVHTNDNGEIADGFGSISGSQIRIVPNNPQFLTYVLRIETNADILDENNNAVISTNIRKTNEDVVVDFANEKYYPKENYPDLDFSQKNVQYVVISQNSQKVSTTGLSFEIYYSVAKNIEDESVNRIQNLTINTEIATKDILINGVGIGEMPNKIGLTLYNQYSSPLYGWKDVFVDVISEFDSSPTYDDLKLTFDSIYLDVRHNGSAIESGQSLKNIDLSIPFQVRGKLGSRETNETDLNVTVLSDILVNDSKTLTATLRCEIIAGASEMSDANNGVFYVDYEDRNIIFEQIWANKRFQEFNAIFVDGSGVDVMSISQGETLCIETDDDNDGTADRYFLGLKLSPKRIGVGSYDIFLDNGISRRVTFNCVNLLKEETTEIRLSNTGNDAVKNVTYSKSSDDVGYYNEMSIEILNSSSRDSILFGSMANLDILANIPSEGISFRPQSYHGITVSRLNNHFTIITRDNGNTTINFTLTGDRLNKETFRKEGQVSLAITVEVTSYSLVDEFYLTNGDDYALSNTIYYGGAEEDKRLTLKTVANHPNSNNFFVYKFANEAFIDIFSQATQIDDEGQTTYIYDVDDSNSTRIIKTELVKETFNPHFVFFTAYPNNSLRVVPTYLETTIIRTYGVETETKNILLAIESGTMFFADNFVVHDAQGASYSVSFTNIYQIGSYGTFDINTFTYTHTFPNVEPMTFTLSAELRQRESSKRYDARITANKYQSVESISLLSGITDLDFDKDNKRLDIGVFTYPTVSTRHDITVQYVPNGKEAFLNNLIAHEIDYKSSESGIYTISISCEEFYNDPSLRDGKELVEIDDLSGTLYIFPSEWGTSYTSLIEGRTPISIRVSYRSGSKKNPYILESAEDIVAINNDKMSLKSHYEIRSNISLPNNILKTPIGIVDGELVGFSGSITGTTSNAEISNVVVSQNSFSGSVNGILYAGLFAKINNGAVIENLTVSGSFESLPADMGNSAYVGLLSGVNCGELVNVGAVISESHIYGTMQSLYFGGLVGLNYGSITQDFGKYDGYGYIFKKYVEQILVEDVDKRYVQLGTQKVYLNQNNIAVDADGKKLKVDGVYLLIAQAQIFSDDILGNYVEINGEKVRVDSNGIEINTQGEKIKYGEDGLPLSSLQDFENQTPKNMAFFNGNVIIDVSNKNVFAGGVVGANSGRIVRISPVADFNIYGYTAYSAYTLITLTGANDASENNYRVTLGGIAGLVSFIRSPSNTTAKEDDIAMPNEADVQETTPALLGLMVGGKLNALNLPLTALVDYVGGLVGYVTTLDEGNVDILENTVRTFVRGNAYVGGVAGFDYYSRGYSQNISVNFGDKNAFDAIDDRENQFFSASIIRTSNISGEVSDLPDTVYMIGNATSNTRNYGETKFEIGSYVNRTLRNDYTNVNVLIDDKASYFGNWLVVSRVSEGVFNIEKSKVFASKSITIKFDKDGCFDLTPDLSNVTAEEKEMLENTSVFFMHYFHVDYDLSGEFGANAQNMIEELNFVTTNSALYPFKINNPEVSIVPNSSSVLDIDQNGNITLKSSGIATITLSSLLNTNVSKTIYIYVVNFFDASISTSIFFETPDYSGTNFKKEGSEIIIRGSGLATVYMLPTYRLADAKTSDGEVFNISEDGILTFKNVAYRLSKNTQLEIEEPSREGNTFSNFQINKQKITFSKVDDAKNTDGVDHYALIPILQTKITINGKGYVFFFKLDPSLVNLNVKYEETATMIRTTYQKYSFKTNEEFSDVVTVTSTNPEELIFYSIRKNGDEEFKQERVPDFIPLNGEYNRQGTKYTYQNYLNSCLSSDLFDIQFRRQDKDPNSFDFTFKVNINSEKYKNRLTNPIEGQYVVTFYSSALEKGVRWEIIVTLDEATLNYVRVANFTNIENISSTSDKIEPGRRGLLAITLNPVEASFDRLTVSNNEINNNEGSGLANFYFAYERITETGVEYEIDEKFGNFQNGGMISFTYSEMISYFNSLNLNSLSSVQYRGKIYISYILSSYNIADEMPVVFDIEVSRTATDLDPFVTHIELQTKIGSYARLVVDDKNAIGDVYYLARGLSYNLRLDSFGYTEDQVTIVVGNTERKLSQLSTGYDFGDFSLIGHDGHYVLTVTSNILSYEEEGFGYDIEVKTRAEKEVENAVVSNINSLKLCLMEYVFNYTYSELTNQDIVEGMAGGAISMAIGNPLTLSLSLMRFFEFNQQDPDIVNKVERFISQMTENVEWKVVLDGQETMLSAGRTITSDFYHIDGLTVTPIRIYDPEEDRYHFTVNGFYTIKKGVYNFSSQSTGANRLYTQFDLNVHEQSTRNSPIPVEDYDDLINMSDDTWYILTKNITIPNTEQSRQQGIDLFTSLNSRIAGLDGNIYTINFDGEYLFESATNIGLFATISENTQLQNIRIRLSKDVTFIVGATEFSVGLLASQNDGVITNAQVESWNNSRLIVTSPLNSTNSYVAGLVATNDGYITNSRSMINISAQVGLAGFVGTNNGLIASSFYRGASLRNQPGTTSEKTAGFVLTNSSTGKIFTSYVSGDRYNSSGAKTNEGSMYYDQDQNNISANGKEISGFAFRNQGRIEDCYSNINLVQSGGYATGFVYENSGSVDRCFSTSVLQNNQIFNFGFARWNTITTVEEQGGNIITTEEGGTIKHSFYFRHEHQGNVEDEIPDVNVSIGSIADDKNADIQILDISDFENLEKFKDYVVTENVDDKSVWFLSDGSEFHSERFNSGRIELVAPNIIAISDRQLQSVENITDPTTGAEYVKYNYIYTGNPLGSAENPILISNAEEFESYISQETDLAGYNNKHYRLIRDIDYQDYVQNSNLYKIKFNGYFEGNFMSVTGPNIISSEYLTFAGLFAEVDDYNNSTGTLMNFTYSPKNVYFSNTNVVGAVTGKLEGGRLFNINVLAGRDGDSVVGNNITGGAVGLTLGDFKLQNIYCQLGATARNQYPTSGNSFNSRANQFNTYSFAGSLVGVLSGSGSLYNSYIDREEITSMSVLGAKAGLMFGLIDEGVNVEKISLEMSAGLLINGYNFAGLLAGESKGDLKNITISGFEGNYTNFRSVPFVASAVGGLAGTVGGGTFDTITMTQSMMLSTKSSNTGFVNVGGIAGTITGPVRFENITIEANIVGFQFVGGIAGTIEESASRVSLTDVSVKGELDSYGMQLATMAVGGLAGYVKNGALINMSKNSTEEVDSDNLQAGRNVFEIVANINSYVYNTSCLVYMGAIFGANLSNGHSIFNTYSTISGTVYIDNLAVNQEGSGKNAFSLKVTESDGTTKTETSPQTDAVQLQEFGAGSAQNSFTSIDVSGSIASKVGDLVFSANFELWGELFLLKEN